MKHHIERLNNLGFSLLQSEAIMEGLVNFIGYKYAQIGGSSGIDYDINSEIKKSIDKIEELLICLWDDRNGMTEQETKLINEFLDEQIKKHNHLLMKISDKNIHVKPKIEKALVDIVKILVSAKNSLNPIRFD